MSEKTSKWIDITKKQPEERVQCFFYQKNAKLAQIGYFIPTKMKHSAGWLGTIFMDNAFAKKLSSYDVNTDKANTITHWQPIVLPALPK